MINPIIVNIRNNGENTIKANSEQIISKNLLIYFL